MKKCLKTTYKASVDNDSLLKYGELRIDFKQVSSPSAFTQYINVECVDEDVILKIIGDGYFTDSSLNQNLGKEKIVTAGVVDRSFVKNAFYVSNSNITLSCVSKYNITMLRHAHTGGAFSLYTNSIKYCPLGYLSLQGQNYTGTLSDLPKTIYELILVGTLINGDIEVLGNMPDLVMCGVSQNCQGDIGKLPAKVECFIGASNLSRTPTELGNFSYNTRRIGVSNKAIAVTGNLTNIEQYLNDTATCDLTRTLSEHSDHSLKSYINVVGDYNTTTNPAAAAIATIKAAGFTVKINNIEM